MARVGVFIDGMEGSIPAAFRKKVISKIQGLPEIALLGEEEDLASPEALQRMAEQLKAEGAERALILGGSPKRYEASFNKFGFPIPLNPYLLTVVNLKALAVAATAEEDAIEKIRTMTIKAVRWVSSADPIPSESLLLKPETLVIGGGITGISIALALAHSGIQVYLLEKGKRLGGRASELRSFYNRPEEVQKWLNEKISEISRNPLVTVLTETDLRRVHGHFGRFQAKVRRSDGTETVLSCSAIVVATGYDVEQNKEGIYAHRSFVSFAEMETLLAESQAPAFYWNGKKAGLVTFVLDQVNSDMKIDSINALKQSLLLQEAFQCQTVILCKDLKVSADGMERLYRKAREQGTLFIKYDDLPKFSIVNGQIRVDVKDTSSIHKADEHALSILSDLIVMSGAFIPNDEVEHLSRLLGLHKGCRGFFMEDNPQLLRVRSNRRGIFVAGGCRFPQEVSETLIEARAAAQEVIALLSGGTHAYDLAVAEVDPARCAVCFTCPRLCPHSAINVEKYAEKNIYLTPGLKEGGKWGAAKVDPVACYGCGICVGECPAKAITLRHLRDEQIYVQMGLTI